jgi:hypothetical protein
MSMSAADLNILRQQLRTALNDFEREFPNAIEQIATHRRAVEEFCNLRLSGEEALQKLIQKQAHIKSAILATWRSLRRVQYWSKLRQRSL